MNVFEIEEKAKEILGDDANICWPSLSEADYGLEVLCLFDVMYIQNGEIHAADGEYYILSEEEIEQNIRSLQKGLEFLRFVRQKCAQDGFEYAKRMRDSGLFDEEWANNLVDECERYKQQVERREQKKKENEMF